MHRNEAQDINLLSVCLTTYNGMPYIIEQLESILQQIPENSEVICADDGSDDGTYEYIQDLDDTRIILLERDRHYGVIKNFERAIKKAKGKYIFLSDQDDIWLPNKIEIMTSALEKDSTLVVHNAYIMENDVIIKNKDYFSILKPHARIGKNLMRNTIIGAMIAFPKELKQYIMPFPEKIGMHDIWIGLIAAAKGKVIFIDEPLMYYRRHNSNISMTFKKSNRPYWIRVVERILTLYYLVRRVYFGK